MGYSDPDKQREYGRMWRAARRAEWFKDKSCAKCGSTEDLQLDHIDPTQKVTHKVWSWSAERREAELSKCQALCEPCHKLKSREQLGITHGFTPRLHGERRTYNAGCRCRLCKDAHRDYNRELRAKKKSSQAL